MKLTLVVERLELGGAESVALAIATQAVAEGFVVDVVSLKSGGLLEQRVPNGARLVTLGETRTAKALQSLSRYLRSADTDAVVAFGDNVNIVVLLALRLARRRIRTGVTIHSPYAYTVDTWSWAKRRIAEPLIRYLYPSADAVVCVSQGVKRSYEALTHGRRSANVTVIPNPVLPKVARARHANGDQPGPYRFIFVGRLAPEKDLPTLLSAFRSVSPELDAELLLFGDGPERSQLERTVEEERLGERVRFRGFERELDAIYGDADCLVLCSRFESFGNVLVEALAYGCRVVSTDCPVGPAEVLEGGRWGRLVPVGSADALAQAMLATARGEQQIDAGGLADHLQRFRVERVFDQYLNALGLRERRNPDPVPDA